MGVLLADLIILLSRCCSVSVYGDAQAKQLKSKPKTTGKTEEELEAEETAKQMLTDAEKDFYEAIEGMWFVAATSNSACSKP